MQPLGDQNCGDYLRAYATAAGGRVYNPQSLTNCQYCPVSNSDQFLAGVAISYDTRWRDYGIGFAYIVFNIFMAVVLYYLIRVRKSSGKGMAERFKPLLVLFKKDSKKENKGTEKAKTPQDKRDNFLP